MDLIALRLFDHIADAGSFTAAATHFRLAVSTVSRQIGGLEAELGQPLFFRHTRAVRLTEAGRRFHLQVRDVLYRLDQAREDLISPEGAPSGSLRVNAPVSFGRRHLVPLLGEFQCRYPGLEVDLVLSDVYTDPVQSGTDLTLRVGGLADSNLIARTLAPMRFVVCASPGYLETHGIPDNPAALAGHNCLVYRGSRGLQYWYFRRSAEEDWQQISVSGNLYCNDADALHGAALQDRGLLLLPTWLVWRELRSGALQVVLEAWQAGIEPMPTALHLVFPPNRLRSPKVSLLVDHLYERIGDPPYWDRADTVPRGQER